MFLLSLEGPASDIKKIFSARVVNLEGFYAVTPLHFHPEKTKRGSEKQLKLGNSHLQSWPAGFRHRGLMMDSCLVAKVCIVCLCLRPSKIQRIFILRPFQVSWFPHRGEMFLRHHLKTMLWVSYLMFCAEKAKGDACFEHLLCQPSTEIHVLLWSRFFERSRKLLDEITIKSNIHVCQKRKNQLLKQFCPEFNTCVMVVPSE